MVDHNMHIMVVDDYSTMRRILRNLLQQLGFTNIDEAADGGEAMTKLKDGQFHFVFSDWNMQPITGLELLRNVRSDPKTKALPFIMVTAEGKPENVMAARAAGVSNYIVKPFNAETLKAKMASVLGAF